MENPIDMDWFKAEIAQKLPEYEFNFRFYNEGDLGALSQVEFNSPELGGNVDFWEYGWLGIFAWNFLKEELLINVLLEPHQKKEKEDALLKLKLLLSRQ